MTRNDRDPSQVFKSMEALYGLDGKELDGALRNQVLEILKLTAIVKTMGKFMEESADEKNSSKLREHAQRLVKGLRSACPGVDRPEKDLLGKVVWSKVPGPFGYEVIPAASLVNGA